MLVCACTGLASEVREPSTGVDVANRNNDRVVLVLASAGLAFCWPLLRRTYAGLLLADLGDGPLQYLAFSCLQFLALGGVCLLLRAHPLTSLSWHVLAFVSTAGYLISLVAFFSDAFALPHSMAMGVLGLVGFAVAVPLSFALWFDVLIRMHTGRALTVLSVSFALSMLVSPLSLLDDPLRGAVLVALPIASMALWAVVNIRMGRGLSLGVDTNSENSDAFDAVNAIACPRELMVLLVLFILVGGVLRGLASPTGVVFSPIDDAEGILFRNAVSLVIAVVLALGSHMSHYSLRSNVIGMIASCMLFLIGLLMTTLRSEALVDQGLNLVAMARTCLEFLLVVTLVTDVHARRMGVRWENEDVSMLDAPGVLARFLVPVYATQVISYAVMPAMLGLPVFSETQSVWVFALACAMLLVAGMLVTMGFMLLRYARMADCNKIGINDDAYEAHGVEATIPVAVDHARKSLLDALAGPLGLSGREVEIAALLSQGHSYKRVAETLSISVSTVQSHTRSLYRKMGVHSRQELLDYLDGR